MQPSGIIIGAKNADALRVMNEKIKTREIKKYYLAVAEGVTDAEGTVTTSLTRDDKKVSVTDGETDGSKKAMLRYKRIAVKNNLSLVEVELLTGRTHQIRAQLAHIGHPLAGDKKYGAKTAQKMQLVSYKLHFDFTSDAGILNYLRGRDFQIAAAFADAFATEKS